MIQAFINSILLIDEINFIDEKCQSNELINNFINNYLKISENEKKLFPLKFKNLDEKLLSEPMSIYDLGDWLVITNVYHNISNDKKKTLKYIKKQADFLLHTLKNTSIKEYKNDYKLTVNSERDIGHLTLAFDGLTYSSITLGDKKYVNYVIDEIRELSKKATLNNLYENKDRKFDTYLMTYGEIFESLFYARFAMDEINDFDYIFYNLYKNYINDFLLPNGMLGYYLLKSEKICFNAMAFEASFYRPLLYFHEVNDKKNIDFINKQIETYEKLLGSIPNYEQCYSKDMSKLITKQEIHIGALYGYLKLKRIQEILGYDTKAKNKILAVLNHLEKKHKKIIGFSDMPKERVGEEFIKDIGGNVWLYNEGLLPLFMSYVNPNTFLLKNPSFQGCNYIYSKK